MLNRGGKNGYSCFVFDLERMQFSLSSLNMILSDSLRKYLTIPSLLRFLFFLFFFFTINWFEYYQQFSLNCWNNCMVFLLYSGNMVNYIDWAWSVKSMCVSDFTAQRTLEGYMGSQRVGPHWAINTFTFHLLALTLTWCYVLFSCTIWISLLILC